MPKGPLDDAGRAVLAGRAQRCRLALRAMLEEATQIMDDYQAKGYSTEDVECAVAGLIVNLGGKIGERAAEVLAWAVVDMAQEHRTMREVAP